MALEDLNDFVGTLRSKNDVVTGLRTSLSSAVDTNPDEYAAMQQSAAKLGIPSSLVPKSPEDRRRLGIQANSGIDDLPDQAPATTRFLSDPENAKLAYDDVENLSGIERFFREYVKKPAVSIKSGLGIGVDMAAFPLASFGDLFRRDDKFKEILSQRIDKFSQMQKESAPDENVGFMGRLMRSLEELAPLLLTGPAAPGIIAGQATAGKGVQLQEEGVTGGVQSGVAALSGATAFAMTKLPFAGKATGSTVRDLATGAARGAAMNPILGMAERAAEKSVLWVTGYDEAADHTKVMDESAIAQDAALGILFGVHGGWEARKARAMDNAQKVTELTDLAKESKLRGRFAPAFNELVSKAAEESGLESVAMPVERFEEFFQSAGKPPEELLSDPRAYYEAKATGSDVVIPIGDYAAHMAEHVTDEHVKDIRFGLGEDTLREVEEAGAAEDKAAEEFRATAAKAEDDAKLKNSEMKVYDDILGGLLGIKIPRDVAEKQASLWAIRARTRAERLGEDPWQLYQERPVEIVRPIPEVLAQRNSIDTTIDPLLERLRSGDIPAESQINGPSLSEFLREKGVSDSKGELAAKGVDEGLKPFQRKMVRKDGISLDRARELAVEAGYLPEGSDINAMLDALDGDLRGKPVYAPEKMDGGAADMGATLSQLKDYLDSKGVDLQTASNEDVRKILKDQLELYQSDPVKYGAGEKRAFIRFGEQKIEIGLLEKADLSSFLHETGHAWFEELRRDAMRDGAPDQVKQDWEKAAKWAGIAPDASSLSVEAHEKFARGVETYLHEGRAPSQDLLPLFQRFKSWIAQAYRRIVGSDVKLSDEVRGVMDRLLATDEEISRAEEMMKLKPLFATAEDAGMTEAEFALYRKTAEKAHEENASRLMRKMMDELTREQKAWWREERAKMMEAVTAEAKQDPAYQAFDAMAKGIGPDGEPLPASVKISRDDLVAMYGEEFVKKLPRSVKAIYTREGGIHPDIAAEMFGFGSGDEMIRRIAETPRMDRYVAAETRQRMLDKYGDMQHDGSIAEEALKAVHGDETGQLLRAELRAIERKRKEVKPFLDEKKREARQGLNEIKESIPPLKYFEGMAQNVIGEKSLRSIKPTVYARAEAKAGREAIEAAGKQDFEAARDAKVRQLTNHYLYMEAVKALEEADTIQQYMKGIDNPKKLGPVGKASVELLGQIQKILSRYEFKKIPFSVLDQEKSLREWVDAFEKEHEDRSIPIDPNVLDENYRVNYREIPMDELRSVYDSVRAIVHAARAISEVQKENRRVSEDLAAEELLTANGIDTFKPEQFRPTDDGMHRAQKLFSVAKKLNAGLRREEFLFELLDKGTEGPWHDYFWNGYLRSENKRREILETIHEPLRKAVEDMPKGQRDRLSDKTLVHIKSLKVDLSRNELFSILLNLGNESNEDKMVRGGFMYGKGSKNITEEGLQEILGTFTKADFDAAQSLWNAVNTVQGEIIALNKRWTGLEPTMVEPRKLVTPFGEYEGGYWPIKYDSRGSSFGEKQDDAAKSVQDMVSFRYRGIGTQKGYTKERTKAAAPILLEWKTVASRHVNDVATDLAYREWTSDARRLLRRDDVKREMQLRLGKTEYDAMRNWLDSTVARDSWGTPGTAAWENVYRAGYANFTTAVLGANLAGAFADVSVTPLLATTRVNWRYVMAGYKEFASNPKKVNEFIKSKSDWHARIEENVDQSLRNSLDYLAAHPTRWSNLMAMTLNMRVWMYHQAANATWIGAYREAIDLGKTEIEAVRIADKVPRMTQHSGDVGSLSALERHPFWKKLLVYAGPVEVAYNAAVNAAHDIRSSKGTDPSAWGRLFAFWFGQSVLWAAVRGRKDDDESWGGFVGRHMLLGPLEAFPVARDVVRYTEERLKGKAGHMQSLPIVSVPKSVADALTTSWKFSQGEANKERLIKDLNIAAGMTAGYPAFQIDVTGQFLYDVLSGQYKAEHPWSPLHDAIYRRKKE